ncbi:MAG: ribosomal protein large subunit ribosomal protein [Candidatus Berkelbacteria bacterium]|nr:ribosomal protein large subunit ribosomal protein [Candidatus Berkelbacteria bacterium]
MAEPKKRITSSRSGKRKSQIILKTKSLTICPTCKEPNIPHRVCASCGYYKGEDILKLSQKAKAKEERRKAREDEEKAEVK